MYNNRRFLSLFGFLEARDFLFLIDYIHIMNRWRHSENNCIYPKGRFVRLNKIGCSNDSLILCTIFIVWFSMLILVVINFHVDEISYFFYTRTILHSLRKQLTLLSIEIYKMIFIKTVFHWNKPFSPIIFIRLFSFDGAFHFSHFFNIPLLSILFTASVRCFQILFVNYVFI